MTSVQVNKIQIYPFQSRHELIKHVENEKCILVAVNAEKILNSNNELIRIINSNIGYADGIGATMALHKKGYKKAIKIPGCELWLSIIEQFYKDKTFYLVGSSDDVVNKTITKLKEDYPSIKIAGYRNGFLKSDNEKEVLINDISSKKPDVVFVAMGTPRQELLMEEMQKKHKAIYQGLGGSFDVYTGKLKRAPKFWIKLKLEWFYRLLLEPTRIKRQFRLLNFFRLLILNKL